MAGKKVLKHTHRLKRHKHKNGEAVYFCTLGECEYKINVALSLGKPTVCWRCGKTFNLDEYSLRLAKPHCTECKKSKDETNHEILIQPDYPSRPVIANDVKTDLLSRLRATIAHVVDESETELDDTAQDDLL